MSQGPYSIDSNPSEQSEASVPSTQASNFSDEQIAAENNFAVKSAMKTSVFKYSKLNSLALGLVPVLMGAGIFVACTSHKDVAVESTTSASVAATTASEKYPDENLEDYTSALKKGKAKHGKKAHQANAAHRSPADNMYVVQVGAFRVKQNAEKLNDKLKSAGYPVEMQQIEHSSNGQLFLVRMNPMADRRSAEDMRMNLKAKIDIDSMILALPKSDREVASVGAGKSAQNTNQNSNQSAHAPTAKDGERAAVQGDTSKTEIR